MIAIGKADGHRQTLAAGQCREKAAAALAFAAAATLDRVRERHQIAADVWLKLAMVYDKALSARPVQAAAPAPIPALN